MSAASLKGRHAVVTGAGGGLGRCIAEHLSAAGARVSLFGRKAEGLAATASACLGETTTVSVDITDAGQLGQAFASCRAELGPVHILVNNAGIAASSSFRKTSPELWDATLATNLTASFQAMQFAIADMTDQGFGRIINIGSTASHTGYAYVAAYCASKHGLIGLTRSVAREFAKTGVTVNAVCPGYLDTPMTRETIANIVARTGRSEAEATADILAGNPQSKLIQVEEVANAVLYLCSDHAASINGQSIMIDGGETA